MDERVRFSLKGIMEACFHLQFKKRKKKKKKLIVTSYLMVVTLYITLYLTNVTFLPYKCNFFFFLIETLNLTNVPFYL